MSPYELGLKGLTRPFLSSTSIGPYTFSTPFLHGSLSSDGRNLIETFHLVQAVCYSNRNKTAGLYFEERRDV